MSNAVNLLGNIVTDFSYNHSLYGECFYKVTLSVKRESGTADLIPLIISERFIECVNVGNCVHVSGEFRSYNQHDKDKSRLKLYVFVHEIIAVENTHNINDVFLEGYICKPPTYRHTPLGREICDVMLAVNRAFNKSDYIPCILWGRNAYLARILSAGDCIRVAGRVQSREYTKDNETKTAYELSVSLLEVC